MIFQKSVIMGWGERIKVLKYLDFWKLPWGKLGKSRIDQSTEHGDMKTQTWVTGFYSQLEKKHFLMWFLKKKK